MALKICVIALRRFLGKLFKNFSGDQVVARSLFFIFYLFFILYDIFNLVNSDFLHWQGHLVRGH